MTELGAITGRYGYGEEIAIDTLDLLPNQSATLQSWILRLPGQAVWDHYQFSLIHLKEIPGADPAVLGYPEAQYEMMLFALDPAKNPVVTDRESWTPLTPINWVKQFHGVDDRQAKQALRTMVYHLVTGHLPAELEGMRGAKELWNHELDVALLAAKQEQGGDRS